MDWWGQCLRPLRPRRNGSLFVFFKRGKFLKLRLECLTSDAKKKKKMNDPFHLLIHFASFIPNVKPKTCMCMAERCEMEQCQTISFHELNLNGCLSVPSLHISFTASKHKHASFSSSSAYFALTWHWTSSGPRLPLSFGPHSAVKGRWWIPPSLYCLIVAASQTLWDGSQELTNQKLLMSHFKWNAVSEKHQIACSWLQQFGPTMLYWPFGMV